MRKYLILCALLFYTIVLCKALPWDKPHTSHIPEINPDIDKDSVVRKRHVNDDEASDIVFPGEAHHPYNNSTHYSAAGKGTDCIDGVCKDAVDYPYEYLQKIKGTLSKYKDVFESLEGASIDFGVRRKPGEADFTPVCTASVYTRYPKTLKTEKDVEKFIVNIEGHRQGLIFETCGKRATCMFAPLFPSTYVSECTQKYMTRRLMSVGNDGNPEFDSFVIPSCCVCTVKEIKKP